MHYLPCRRLPRHWRRVGLGGFLGDSLLFSGCVFIPMRNAPYLYHDHHTLTPSKSFPDSSPTPAPAPSSPQDTSHDVEVTRVHLPAPATAYPVVPFEHTLGAHANAAASTHLLADHINGLSVSSRRQLGIILKKR